MRKNGTPCRKTDSEIAEEGLILMSEWMREIGLVMHIQELGVNDSNINQILDAVMYSHGGYKDMTRDDVLEILKASM